MSIPCDGFFPRNSDLIAAFIVLPPTQPRMVDTQGGMRKACIETGKRNFLSTNSARRAVTAAIGSTSSSSAAEANSPPVFCSFPKPLTLSTKESAGQGEIQEKRTLRGGDLQLPIRLHQDQNAVAFIFLLLLRHLYRFRFQLSPHGANCRSEIFPQYLIGLLLHATV